MSDHLCLGWAARFCSDPRCWEDELEDGDEWPAREVGTQPSQRKSLAVQGNAK